MDIHKRKSSSIAIALPLILLFALAPSFFLHLPASFAATSTTFYVSQSGSDSAGNGSLSSPFATITHAVSAASAGDKIVVFPGTYNEMVVITKTLTLESKTLQPSTTIINATGKAVGIGIVGPAAAGTLIQGLTVENANGEGILAQDSSKVLIENNVLTGNGVNPTAGLGEVKAIELLGTSGSTVADNTVAGNNFGGIGVSDDGSDDPSWNATANPTSGIPAGTPNPGDDNVISGNSVIGNSPHHCSLVISASNAGEGVSNNVVSNNIVVNNVAGIIVAADVPDTFAINNSVISNTILNNGEAGVVIHSNAAGDVVTGNVISMNVIGNDGSGAKIAGIIVGGESPLPSVAPVKTLITGNTFHDEYYAIQIVNANFTTVGGNTMDSTVTVPVNGTVVSISTANTVVQTTPASAGGSTTIGETTTVDMTTTIASTIVQAIVLSQTGSVGEQTATVVGSLGVVIAIVASAVAVAALRKKP